MAQNQLLSPHRFNSQSSHISYFPSKLPPPPPSPWQLPLPALLLTARRSLAGRSRATAAQPGYVGRAASAPTASALPLLPLPPPSPPFCTYSSSTPPLSRLASGRRRRRRHYRVQLWGKAASAVEVGSDEFQPGTDDLFHQRRRRRRRRLRRLGEGGLNS